ncbi:MULTISPECIES: hypothetical protein [Actinomycetes]|uniref:hypothetical protein n=1 Tax=Actinomycetes TaxID=1760 RepID=UPI001319BD90|nr:MULTISPECIES: hypothetical protein [Actinomycetes]
MPGPRNEFEEHLVQLADGVPGFHADVSEVIGYDLEEPRVAVGCPRCGRTLNEDEKDRMTARTAAGARNVLICFDCECAEEARMLRGGGLLRRRGPGDPAVAGIRSAARDEREAVRIGFPVPSGSAPARVTSLTRARATR